MMLNFNIFSLKMKEKILRDVYSSHVVTHDIHGVLLNVVVTEHFLHPNKMGITTSYYNYFASIMEKDTKFCFLLSHATK